MPDSLKKKSMVHSKQWYMSRLGEIYVCSTEYTALLPGFCLLRIYHAPGEHVTSSLITCLLSTEITKLRDLTNYGMIT